MVFSKKKKEGDKIIGIIDIGSAQVDGAVIRIADGEPKEVLAEAREDINFSQTPDFKQFQFSIEKALGKVLDLLVSQTKGVKDTKPKEFFIFLATPFFSSQIKTLRAQEPKAVKATADYVNGMAKQDKLPINKDELLLEDEIIGLKLNGYTNSFFDQTADLIEIQRFTSWGPKAVLSRFQDIIEKHYPAAKVKFQTFLLAGYKIFNDLLPNRDFILLDTGNELADLIIVKDKVLAGHLAFPGGKNLLIRELAGKLNTLPTEAASVLNLYSGNKSNQQLQIKIKRALENLATDWQNSFKEALGQTSGNIFLPETIYLIGDTPVDSLIANFIETADLGDITFGSNKMEAIFIEKLLAESIRHLTGQNPPLTNTWSLAEAIFCAKIKQ